MKVVLADSQYLTRAGLAVLIKQNPLLSLVSEVDSFHRLPGVIAKMQPALAVVGLQGSEENLLSQIRQIRKSSKTPFLVISDTHDKTQVRRLLSAGATSILTKTCNQDQLKKGLEVTASGEKYFCRGIAKLIESDPIKSVDEIESQDDAKSLTSRELEVLELIVKGLPTVKIAEKMHLSFHTINSHRKNILKKLDMKSPAELIVHALEQGLVKY
ncbi:MAG: response regulator transcription factor [Bacteroidota bacterium]